MAKPNSDHSNRAERRRNERAVASAAATIARNKARPGATVSSTGGMTVSIDELTQLIVERDIQISRLRRQISIQQTQLAELQGQMPEVEAVTEPIVDEPVDDEPVDDEPVDDEPVAVPPPNAPEEVSDQQELQEKPPGETAASILVPTEEDPEQVFPVKSTPKEGEQNGERKEDQS